MVMMVSVPERPSTPSEQFVTLIDTQTKMTVSIPNTTGGIFTEPPNMAKVIVLDSVLKIADSFNYCILLFAVCLLGYLWYNATPSKLLMGDAGSRAMGIFIAICALKSQSPFIYILAALVLIIDGGLGLIKVSLLRFLKIHILKNTTTPIHDHVRKKLGWSNAQVVFRFAIIQIVVSLATVYLVMI